MQKKMMDNVIARPTEILVAVNDPIIESQLTAALDTRSKLSFTRLDRVSGLDEARLPSGAVLIVWYDLLRRLRDTDPAGLVQLSRRMPVIVALSRSNLLEAAGVLALADAWLFVDTQLDRLEDVISLGGRGYSLLPDFIEPSFGADELRRNLIAELSGRERQVLRELGRGSSNRIIAEQLKISEANAKSLVRNVLGKLHFRNRTEAGVFMARYADPATGELSAAVPPPHITAPHDTTVRH
jgi:two-component system nitrate/nitrite response regulator NarL